VIALEIGSRNARVQELQDELNRLRQVITERAEHYRNGGDDQYDKAIPGGTTGLLCKSWVGKDADRPVYKVDTAILAELRATARQAAEELGQWKIRTVVEATVAITPAAAAMARLLTPEQLDELERAILEE
jgi:hypothetical protein